MSGTRGGRIVTYVRGAAKRLKSKPTGARRCPMCGTNLGDRPNTEPLAGERRHDETPKGSD